MIQKLLYHRISLALFPLFLSHVAKATLLRHKTKITQRYATPALTNIGELCLKLSPYIFQPYFYIAPDMVKIFEKAVCRKKNPGTPP